MSDDFTYYNPTDPSDPTDVFTSFYSPSQLLPSSSSTASFSPEFLSQHSLSPPNSFSSAQYPVPGLSSAGSTGSQSASPQPAPGVGASPDGGMMMGFAAQDIQRLMTTSNGGGKPSPMEMTDFSDLFSQPPPELGPSDPRYLSNDALIGQVFGLPPSHKPNRPHTSSISSTTSNQSQFPTFSPHQAAILNLNRRTSLAYSDSGSINSGLGAFGAGLMADDQTGYPVGSGMEQVPMQVGVDGFAGWAPGGGMMFVQGAGGQVGNLKAQAGYIRTSSGNSSATSNYSGGGGGGYMISNSRNSQQTTFHPASYPSSANYASSYPLQPSRHQQQQQPQQPQPMGLPMPTSHDFRSFGNQQQQLFALPNMNGYHQQGVGGVQMEQVGSGGVNMAQISGVQQQQQQQHQQQQMQQQMQMQRAQQHQVQQQMQHGGGQVWNLDVEGDWAEVDEGKGMEDMGLGGEMIRGMEAMSDPMDGRIAPSPIQSIENLPRHVEETRATSSARPKVKGDAEKLHNIVEQRYRKNVQGSLNMLRDSVPRLRHLYRTSTPMQLATTDVEVNGLMGGLPDLGKETKKTVLVGSRMYIVYLEREAGRQQRRAELAENFIKMSMAKNDPSGSSFEKWRLRSEAELEKMQVEPDRAAAEEERRLQTVYLDAPAEGEEDGEEEGSQEERPKKRMRGGEVVKGKTVVAEGSKAKKPRKSAGKTSIAAAGSVLSSFSVAYTFFPKGSKLFATSVVTSTPVSHSSGRVLMNAPYAVASKSSEMLARALPKRSVPEPDMMMDWAWLLILAAVLTAVTWITLEHFVIGSAEEREVAAVIEQREREDELEKAMAGGPSGAWRLKKLLGVGGAGGLVQELAVAGLAKARIVSAREENPAEEKAWVAMAEAAVGGACKLNALGRWHIALRLSRDLSSSNSAALLALLLPKSKNAKKNWESAGRMSSLTNDAVVTPVLSLPFREAKAMLLTVQPTTQPIASMADQLVLIHLNDLLTRIYLDIVRSSCKAGSDLQLKSLAENMKGPSLSKSLNQSAFKLEVQDVLSGAPKGSEGYALGLVLIGLWGIVAGQDPLMQRHLANLLVLEHMQGLVGGKLKSVETLLALISPGRPALLPPMSEPSPAPAPPSGLSEMATKVDVLAQVCIEWIRLLSLVPMLATEASSRQDRLASSTLVKASATHLRVLLAHPAFIRTFETRRSADEDLSSSSSDDGSSSAESVDGQEGPEGPQPLDLEVEAFDKVTDRFIDVLSVIGRRAAKRSTGRDDDSGIEGDIEEL